MRDFIGYLASVSSVKISGRSTRPWISSLCLSGSMSGTPECSRTKCSPFGVMVPLSRCSGVRMEPSPGGAFACCCHAGADDVLLERDGDP